MKTEFLTVGELERFLRSIENKEMLVYIYQDYSGTRRPVAAIIDNWTTGVSILPADIDERNTLVPPLYNDENLILSIGE